MVDQITFASGASMLPVSASPQPAASRSASVAQASPQSPAPDSGSHDAAVAQVNQHLQQSQSDLKLTVDRGSGRPVFQVVQQGTGQVLFQVPSAEVLGMSRRVRELQDQTMNSGALVDQQG
jgi:flagellar protein FlaG